MAKHPRDSRSDSLVSSPARPTPSTISPTTTGPSTATAATTITTAATGTTAATAAISAVRPVAASNMRHAVAVKVRFAFGFVREIAAAFNDKRSGWRSFAFWSRSHICSAARGYFAASTTHFRALFFQNRLARQSDAVPFDRQYLHQHLVAFLQLVANIANAMLRHFADVQQPIGPGNNLDERAEIRQPRHLPQISLPDFRSRRQVANDLQRFRCRGLIARRNLHQSGILHVDLDPGLFHDAANHLA